MSDGQEAVLDPRDVTIRRQAETIRQQADRLKQLEDEVKRLLALLKGKADSKAAKKPVFKENYSLDRNKNKKKKLKRKSTGRKPTRNKRDLATQAIDVYAAGVAREECVRRRLQFAWRIFDGKAVYVCYQIYDLPDSTSLPVPAGLRNSRSEFGIEIVLILAFLHYWVGVSLDNARQIMNFFTGLNLSKGQADSLLSQLANDWDEQYDTIAQLIALQMIVYIDETGWKVGDKSCYTWVFSTSMHVLYRCGVSRKKTEATDILGESFGGVDLRPGRFADGEVAQTSVARLNTIVVRADLGDVPAFQLLGDSASAAYYLSVLMDAMAEFDGRLVGLTALRKLAGA